MRLSQSLSVKAAALALLLASDAMAADLAVGITRSLDKFEGTVNGKPVVIMRNQDQTATVNPAFAKTSRKCPPFCIQPMQLSPGVETIGEVKDMIDRSLKYYPNIDPAEVIMPPAQARAVSQAKPRRHLVPTNRQFQNR